MVSANQFLSTTDFYFDKTTSQWNYGAFCKACYSLPDFPTDPQLRKRLVPEIWAAQLARQAHASEQKKALAAPHLANLKVTASTTNNININNGFVNCQIDALYQHRSQQEEASNSAATSSKRKATATEDDYEPLKVVKRPTTSASNTTNPPPYSSQKTETRNGAATASGPHKQSCIEEGEENTMNIRQHFLSLQHDFRSKMADIDELLQHHLSLLQHQLSIVNMLQTRRANLQRSFDLQLSKGFDHQLLRDNDDQLTERDSAPTSPAPLPTSMHWGSQTFLHRSPSEATTVALSPVLSPDSPSIPHQQIPPLPSEPRIFTFTDSATPVPTLSVPTLATLAAANDVPTATQSTPTPNQEETPLLPTSNTTPQGGSID